MGTVLTANAPQTLYVTIRRDELRQLREERALLQKKVAQLTSMMQHAQMIGSSTALHA
jgi:predicted transcriptional regulator